MTTAQGNIVCYGNKELWLKAREAGVGGSDAAAIKGVNPYRDALRVYGEKLGLVEPFVETEKMRLGTELQPWLLGQFQKDTGLKAEGGTEFTIAGHDDYPFMLASVDGFAFEGKKRGIWEAKVTSAHMLAKWEQDQDGNPICPEMYRVQVEHYMCVYDLDFAWVTVMVGVERVLHFRFERDPEREAELVRMESEFWEMVQNKVQPVATDSESSEATLKALYPEGIDATPVELGADFASIARGYDDARAAKSAAEKALRTYGNQIRDALKDHSLGLAGNWEVKLNDRVRQMPAKDAYVQRYREINVKEVSGDKT